MHPSTTEIYTLSLHDALPILVAGQAREGRQGVHAAVAHADRLGGGKRVLSEARLDHHRVVPRRYRVTVREPGGPAQVHLAVPGARVDHVAPPRPEIGRAHV